MSRNAILSLIKISAVRKNSDQSKNKPCKGGKSQTAQGERSVTLGISPLNSHNDSHRVDSVSLETDGIVVAMTYPENHCIGEYAIPYRNAISVNAGLKQCCSMSYPGLRFAHPGLSDSCRPFRACFPVNQRCFRMLSFFLI